MATLPRFLSPTTVPGSGNQAGRSGPGPSASLRLDRAGTARRAAKSSASAKRECDRPPPPDLVQYTRLIAIRSRPRKGGPDRHADGPEPADITAPTFRGRRDRPDRRGDATKAD
jgi:hypothetical protein